jgi:hypothetical protein
MTGYLEMKLELILVLYWALLQYLLGWWYVFVEIGFYRLCEGENRI